MIDNFVYISRTLRVPLLLSVMVCLAVLGVGCGRRPAPGKGRIVGKVIDQQGLPVSGCIVSLDNGSARDITDRRGYYALEDIEPGPVTMRILKLGYLRNRSSCSGLYGSDVLPNKTIICNPSLKPSPPEFDSTDPGYQEGWNLAEQELAMGYASWFNVREGYAEYINIDLHSIVGIPEVLVGDCGDGTIGACVAGHNDRILHYIEYDGLPPFPRWWPYLQTVSYKQLFRGIRHCDCGDGKRVVISDDPSQLPDPCPPVTGVRHGKDIYLNIACRDSLLTVVLKDRPHDEMCYSWGVDSLDILIIASCDRCYDLIDLRTARQVPLYRLYRCGTPYPKSFMGPPYRKSPPFIPLQLTVEQPAPGERY